MLTHQIAPMSISPTSTIVNPRPSGAKIAGETTQYAAVAAGTAVIAVRRLLIRGGGCMKISLQTASRHSYTVYTDAPRNGTHQEPHGKGLRHKVEAGLLRAEVPVYLS